MSREIYDDIMYSYSISFLHEAEEPPPWKSSRPYTLICACSGQSCLWTCSLTENISTTQVH